jgi:magnesium chelatase family protein
MTTDPPEPRSWVYGHRLGKPLLSRRLPGILPSLTFEEALETTMVYSVAGMLGQRALIRERPFRAPTTRCRWRGWRRRADGAAGEISLAHDGGQFLDELLEFSRPALETLRQSREERSIAIVRTRRTVSFLA